MPIAFAALKKNSSSKFRRNGIKLAIVVGLVGREWASPEAENVLIEVSFNRGYGDYICVIYSDSSTGGYHRTTFSISSWCELVEESLVT
jgi:hypothetical protein